eukprot:1348674-Pleurochrysis_carterae.AAC.1
MATSLEYNTTSSCDLVYHTTSASSPRMLRPCLGRGMPMGEECDGYNRLHVGGCQLNNMRLNSDAISTRKAKQHSRAS